MRPAPAAFQHVRGLSIRGRHHKLRYLPRMARDSHDSQDVLGRLRRSPSNLASTPFCFSFAFFGLLLLDTRRCRHAFPSPPAGLTDELRPPGLFRGIGARCRTTRGAGASPDGPRPFPCSRPPTAGPDLERRDRDGDRPVGEDCLRRGGEAHGAVSPRISLPVVAPWARGRLLTNDTGPTFGYGRAWRGMLCGPFLTRPGVPSDTCRQGQLPMCPVCQPGHVAAQL